MPTAIDSIHVHFSNESLFLLNLCLGYIMFGVALEINKEDFIHLIKHPKTAFVGVLSQYIIFPVLTFLLIKIIHPHPSIALGMILVAACPSGNVSNFITNTAKGNTVLSISLTALSTVLSPILTPLIFTLFGKMDSETAHLMQTIHISFIEMLKSLLLLLFIPLIAGIGINYYFPVITQKSKRFLKPHRCLFF